MILPHFGITVYVVYICVVRRDALLSICDVNCAQISAKTAGGGGVNGVHNVRTKIQNGVRRYWRHANV